MCSGECLLKVRVFPTSPWSLTVVHCHSQLENNRRLSAKIGNVQKFPIQTDRSLSMIKAAEKVDKQAQRKESLFWCELKAGGIKGGCFVLV